MDICVLASGSSGNATYVASNKTRLLVDCGLAAKEVVKRLAEIGVDPSTLAGILITHAHSDHYKAAGTIQARFGVPVFTEWATVTAIRAAGNPGSFGRVTDCRPIPESIGDITIETFPVPHGATGAAGGPVGFVLRHGGMKVCIATDLGRVTAAVKEALRGSDVIILEANYHEPIIRKKLKERKFARDWDYLTWVLSNRGHLSNVQCGEALAEALTGRTTHVFLAHISENHSIPGLDNNRYDIAVDEVMRILKEREITPPIFVRTYRRGRTEGRRSECISI
jgi:phosphoribosyl 1,2-cyclic phosphodiesterase